MDSYEATKIKTVRYKKIKKLLLETYGYEDFRPRQYEIINSIINGNDAFGIMPTGGGKSLCYQIPALYRNKPAIIIQPLISLMDDQKLILDGLGLTSCCYNSTVANKEQLLEEIIDNQFQFVFTTPESISNLRYFLGKLNRTLGISLVAIDEAHCISSYGHDFRPKYRELGCIKEILPDVPILAVTATATPDVMHDIQKSLRITADPILTSFDRPNLYLSVKRKSKEMYHDIIPLIQKHTNEAIIIYCVTKKDTDKVADLLTGAGVSCGVYHSDVDNATKARTHKRFIQNKLKVVVATIAFGMGINKPDVRAVIHYGCPKSVAGYYQEIGRAGRDGKPSVCYTFFDNRDFMKHNLMVNGGEGNKAHKQAQTEMIDEMKDYVNLATCRRKYLLAHFNEHMNKDCDNCDNCCEDKTEVIAKLPKVKQDVNTEAKMLINMIDSLDKRFGKGMYIDILRGSKRKAITPLLQKNEYYGKGKHKSADWWKELIDYLLRRNYLKQVQVTFKMQVIETTNDGSIWASLSEVPSMSVNCDPIDPIAMTCIS